MKSARKVLRVGLTGSFGSGKSTVARYFQKWGAHRIDSDKLAHEALRRGTPTYRKVVRAFGRAILDGDKQINRKRLGTIVFRNSKNRKKLEKIVHPYVFRKIREECRKLYKGIVIIEVPLLFETGFDRWVDRTITVLADKKKLIRRMRSARMLKRNEIVARLKAQMPIAIKRRRSSFVIDNNHGLKQTREESRRVWVQLTKEIKKER